MDIDDAHGPMTPAAGVTSPSVSGFEGSAGRLAAAVMVRLNRDMEAAAVADLDPRPMDRVLSIGFGPGVGLAHLERRLPDGAVAGIDPSATMVAIAARRNRSAIRAGRMVLRQAGAEAIPWPDDSFDAVVAVNSIQLWQPLEVAVGEVARVLRPGGTLVTVTHEWALQKRAPVAQWVGEVSVILERHGLDTVTSRTNRFRTGDGLVLRATTPTGPLLL